MKLGRVFRKYVPFVLIAILIACLFSKPQREGMKKLKIPKKIPKIPKIKKQKNPVHWPGPKKSSPSSIKNNPGAQVGLGIAGDFGLNMFGLGVGQSLKYLGNRAGLDTPSGDEVLNREIDELNHSVDDIQSRPQEIRNDIEHPKEFADKMEDIAEDPKGDFECANEHPLEFEINKYEIETDYIEEGE